MHARLRALPFGSRPCAAGPSYHKAPLVRRRISTPLSPRCSLLLCCSLERTAPGSPKLLPHLSRPRLSPCCSTFLPHTHDANPSLPPPLHSSQAKTLPSDPLPGSRGCPPPIANAHTHRSSQCARVTRAPSCGTKSRPPSERHWVGSWRGRCCLGRERDVVDVDDVRDGLHARYWRSLCASMGSLSR